MASEFSTRAGRAEVRQAERNVRGLVLTAAFFSIFVNLLMLTGPIYMLQVYDRVLGSRSEATLVALSILLVVLFIAMGFLDHARGRLFARAGGRLQAQLDRRVFAAALSRASVAPSDPLSHSAQRDLQSIQQFWASPIAGALMDMPWAPIFIAAIFVFHPLLGWLAVAGGALLIAVTLINQFVSREPVLRATRDAVKADQIADKMKSDAEVLRALGMQSAAFQRWAKAREAALGSNMASTDISGGFGAGTKTLRLFLQSAILGLGAWLVLQGELTPGAMIAASIILGRALAPIEQAIGQWALLTRAREGRANLIQLLSIQPPQVQPMSLPRPRAQLDVSDVSVLLSGNSQPVLRSVSFRLEPGQALGVIGPSGAGKSTLGRAIVGAVRPAAGKIRLGGAELDQYDPEVLGNLIGYLPQNVALFDASIAENIARLAVEPDPDQIVRAAKAAAAHDMILSFPKGYDTPLTSVATQLSGGQIQRLGLARALYGNPVLLVLDEPNSNLDNDGSVALNGAIRQLKANGGSVIIIAHRPAALTECDLLLMLDGGLRRAFGPRDEVLRSVIKNSSEIVAAKGIGGVT